MSHPIAQVDSRARIGALGAAKCSTIDATGAARPYTQNRTDLVRLAAGTLPEPRFRWPTLSAAIILSTEKSRETTLGARCLLRVSLLQDGHLESRIAAPTRDDGPAHAGTHD